MASIDQAIQQAVLTSLPAPNPNTTTVRLAVFNADGSPASLPGSGAQMKLTGYTSGSAGNVSATDSVNAAIAKLEARIAALESA